MIGGKFYTVEVKPTIAASVQHEGAFSSGDVVFDWTAFEIPKTTAKLVNLTVLVRPQGNSGPTANTDPYHFIFADNNTVSLGTPHANPNHRPSNDFLGVVQVSSSGYTGDTHNSTAVGMAMMGGTADDETVGGPIVMTPNLNVTGCTEGYGTLYVGGIIRDASLDFSSIIRLNDASGNMDVSVAGTTIATDGSSMDIREHFMAGDVLHAHKVGDSSSDNAVIGTVASITDEDDLELTSNFTAGALEDDDFVYNIHPIRLKLQFEI